MYLDSVQNEILRRMKTKREKEGKKIERLQEKEKGGTNPIEIYAKVGLLGIIVTNGSRTNRDEGHVHWQTPHGVRSQFWDLP